MHTNVTSQRPSHPQKPDATRPQKRRSARSWRTPLLAAALITSAASAGGSDAADTLTKYPPTGQLVDVGGYRLHLDCRGHGGPTVVLEAGNGETGMHWSLVQPEVAKFTRVCVYDRAGYGWSDPSPKPRTYSVMINELHALLRNARVPGPYVLAGHSTGGVIARQYAYRYPREVQSLVLVDSATEGQLQRFPDAVKQLQDPKQLLAFLRQAETVVASGDAARNPDAIMPIDPRLPTVAAETFRALLLSNPKQLIAARQEFEGTLNERWQPLRTLGNLKLIVLRRDPTALAASLPPTVPANVIQQSEAVWAQLQNELAALSTNAKVIVAERSGHAIQVERPDLVIQAIREASGK